MPKHPLVDPPLDHFGLCVRLEDLEDNPSSDQPRQGRAPWVSTRRASTSQPSLPSLRQGMSPLVIGGGVFGTGMYDGDDHIRSTMPTRVLRLAFRYGFNAIDTSPYYYPSEFILGQALRALAPEFPRSSYYLGSKCGRYGPQVADFDYSPEKIRSSILASCSRLGTDYLDTALLHDVEFVADHVGPSNVEGWSARDASLHSDLGRSTRSKLGLAPGDASRVHGSGDLTVIAAVRELFRLKDEGVVRAVGISGYPLPVLLRIARLVATTAPFRPLDVILSYSNQTLHSDILGGYEELFREVPLMDRALAREAATGSSAQSSRDLDSKCDPDFVPSPTYLPPLILNGSPFSMGLLTDSDPPTWHPASETLRKIARESSRAIREDSVTGIANAEEGAVLDKGLASTALIYGIRGSERRTSLQLPPGLTTTPVQRTVLGMSTTDHVHAAVHAYRVLLASAQTGMDEVEVSALQREQRQTLAKQYEKQLEHEAEVKVRMREGGMQGWSWASPPADAL